MTSKYPLKMAWGELTPLLPLDEDEKKIMPSTPSVEQKWPVRSVIWFFFSHPLVQCVFGLEGWGEPHEEIEAGKQARMEGSNSGGEGGD